MAKPEKFEHLHLVYHFTVPFEANRVEAIQEYPITGKFSR